MCTELGFKEESKFGDLLGKLIFGTALKFKCVYGCVLKIGKLPKLESDLFH